MKSLIDFLCLGKVDEDDEELAKVVLDAARDSYEFFQEQSIKNSLEECVFSPINKQKRDEARALRRNSQIHTHKH